MTLLSWGQTCTIRHSIQTVPGCPCPPHLAFESRMLSEPVFFATSAARHSLLLDCMLRMKVGSRLLESALWRLWPAMVSNRVSSNPRQSCFPCDVGDYTPPIPQAAAFSLTWLPGMDAGDVIFNPWFSSLLKMQRCPSASCVLTLRDIAIT